MVEWRWVGWIDEWLEERKKMEDGYTDKCTERWIDEWLDRWSSGWIERERNTVSRLNYLKPECPTPAAEMTGSAQRDI